MTDALRPPPCPRCGGLVYDAADSEDRRQGILHAWTCLLCATVTWDSAPAVDWRHARFHGLPPGRPRKAVC